MVIVSRESSKKQKQVEELKKVLNGATKKEAKKIKQKIKNIRRKCSNKRKAVRNIQGGLKNERNYLDS